MKALVFKSATWQSHDTSADCEGMTPLLLIWLMWCLQALERGKKKKKKVTVCNHRTSQSLQEGSWEANGQQSFLLDRDWHIANMQLILSPSLTWKDATILFSARAAGHTLVSDQLWAVEVPDEAGRMGYLHFSSTVPCRSPLQTPK